jgi:hypothetical protein
MQIAHDLIHPFGIDRILGMQDILHAADQTFLALFGLRQTFLCLIQAVDEKCDIKIEDAQENQIADGAVPGAERPAVMLAGEDEYHRKTADLGSEYPEPVPPAP